MASSCTCGGCGHVLVCGMAGMVGGCEHYVDAPQPDRLTFNAHEDAWGGRVRCLERPILWGGFACHAHSQVKPQGWAADWRPVAWVAMNGTEPVAHGRAADARLAFASIQVALQRQFNGGKE